MKFTSKQNYYVSAIAQSLTCQFTILILSAMGMGIIPGSQQTIAKQKPLELAQQSEKKAKGNLQKVKSNTITTGLWQKNEIAKLQALTVESIQTTLGLSGLNKIPAPPQFPPGLKAYRQTWFKSNREITPFLGFWVNDWEMFEPQLAIAVFPSTIKGQICLVEYQDNGNYTPPPGETLPPNPPPRFSSVKVVNGQINTGKLRSHKSLIIQKEGIEFLGIIKGKEELRIYAAKSVSKLDTQLSPQILQQLRTHKCQTTSPS